MLNKPITLDAAKTFFWSDMHLHHKDFVWGARGYTTQAEHDDALIRLWNARVGQDDTVVNLGDFALSDGDAAITRNAISRMNGKMIYVNGNHPSGVKVLYAEAMDACNLPSIGEFYPLTWKNKITFVGDIAEIHVGHQRIICSHFPLATWEDMAKGTWNLCGHEHGGYWASQTTYTDSKRQDMAVDLWPDGPVPFAELEKLMAHKRIPTIGHH